MRMINYEFLYDFGRKVLDSDKSVRWVGIANEFGVLLNVEQRKGLVPFMTEEENEEYAENTITRYKSRIKYESKIGKLVYALGKYQKIDRVTISINQKYYLLIALDNDSYNTDDIIMNKIMPLIEQNKNYFEILNTN